MKKFSLIFAICIVVFAVKQRPLEAYTGSTFIEGNELQVMCEGIDDEGNATNTMAVGCSQFVIGVHDTMSTLTFGGLLEKGFVCFPEDYSGPQLSLVVKKYLEDNPDKSDEPANMLVAVAFVENFPCPKE